MSERSPAALSQEFHAVFAREFAYVCRSLRRLGVRPADIPDVSQELFVSVHHRFSDYNPDRPIRAWLLAYAVRFAANYRRLARNRFEVLHAEAPVERSEDRFEVAHEAKDLVVRTLDRLDFDRRVVIVMHDLEGSPAPEIAKALGIPLNTVYSRLRLARIDFRAGVEALQLKEVAG